MEYKGVMTGVGEGKVLLSEADRDRTCKRH